MSRFTPSADVSSHLRVVGVSFSYADRRVLTDVSFTLSAGDRAGLIGDNGSGKSTLLRVVAGLLMPAAGKIALNCSLPHEGRIGLLHQEPSFVPESRIGDAIEASVAAARQAGEAVTSLATTLASNPEDQAAASAYACALESAERLQAWELDVGISRTLAGLGLGGIDRDRAIGSLSGGERARLSLACLLLSAPYVLLLDEPTNHLDDAATNYLAGVLTAWRGPVLLASHDRAFLDDVATSIIDLDPSPLPRALASSLGEDGSGTGIGVTRFGGSFSEYLAASSKARERWERRYRDEQEELARLKTAANEQVVGHAVWRPRTEVRAARKFYADRNARVLSRRVTDARKRLAALEQSQLRRPPDQLEFPLAPVGNVAPVKGLVLSAARVSVRGRLDETSISISGGEQWLITGPNGVGKTTLLHLLAGLLEPTGGRVSLLGNVRVGILQQVVTLADPCERGAGRTAREAYEDLVGPLLAEAVPLGTFGLIEGRDHNRPVSELSVGQQRRLALAVALADPPDVLLLDEPTNHFSLSLATALELALPSYQGAVVIASHDRWLRRRWTGLRLELA